VTSVYLCIMDSPRLDVNTVDVIQLDPSMNSVTLHQENADAYPKLAAKDVTVANMTTGGSTLGQGAAGATVTPWDHHTVTVTT